MRSNVVLHNLQSHPASKLKGLKLMRSWDGSLNQADKFKRCSDSLAKCYPNSSFIKVFSLIPDNRHPCRHWDGAQGSTLISSREAEPRTLPQFSIKVILLWSSTNVIIITKRSPAAVAPLFEDWGRQLLRHLYGAIPPHPHDANQLL